MNILAKRERIEEIQYLRGFAFLAVVLQHAIGHYAYLPEAGVQDGAMLGILLIAAKFAVPMFIFITGLVLFYNYTSEVSFWSFIGKRCKDILVPYILWSTVYALWFQTGGEGLWSGLKIVVADWFTGKASYHLWYVVMSIQLYLLFPPIQRAVLPLWRRSKPWTLRAGFALLCLVYVLLTTKVGVIGEAASKLHIPVLTPLFTEYADRNALYFFIYFVMGAAAGLNLQAWKQWMLKRQGVFLSLYAILSCILFYKIMASFRTKDGYVIQYNDTLLVQPFMAVFLLLSVVTMCIAAVWLHQYGNGRLKKLFNLLGQYSYGAYLAHALMLTAGTFAADALLPGWNVSLRTVIAFIFCALLSVLTAAALGKFRLGRFMTGAPAPRKRDV
ncbi:Acyltransferase family protein [Paenibacillus konkukensis]|uniref:Acyltransferase family protein n=1 Tax=Paenibacillus konkukensis TaxID=2020716 RepID=A0ABY4RXU7_9BACL|nr:acyltransferase [Paenibacillus konkukensis]UQZ87132.1 Acyltransferase family protein [Paenibacillus konkukensis]